MIVSCGYLTFKSLCHSGMPSMSCWGVISLKKNTAPSAKSDNGIVIAKHLAKVLSISCMSNNSTSHYPLKECDSRICLTRFGDFCRMSASVCFQWLCFPKPLYVVRMLCDSTEYWEDEAFRMVFHYRSLCDTDTAPETGEGKERRCC